MISQEFPPVLLLHGFASTAEHGWGRTGWVELLEDSGRTVIAPDLPYHGAATTPEHDLWSKDVAARITSVAAEETVLDAVGFSAGARILVALAAARPERFRRLVLMGVGMSALSDQETGPLITALTSTPDRADVSAFLWRRLAASAGNDPHLLAKFLRNGQPPIHREQLARINAPVLVLVGEDDPAGPADELAAAFPNGTARSFSGLDHFATPSDLRCLDAALTFLET